MVVSRYRGIKSTIAKKIRELSGSMATSVLDHGECEINSFSSFKEATLPTFRPSEAQLRVVHRIGGDGKVLGCRHV